MGQNTQKLENLGKLILGNLFVTTDGIDMNNINYFFWWMAAADRDNLEISSTRARMLYTCLGVVFLVNFIFLAMIWTKVGLQYFGLGGLILGFIIPCGFVLGIDRIISMSHRPLAGVLGVYGIRTNRTTNTALILRVSLSIILCLASTFTFQLQQSQSLISAKSADTARIANQSLHQELVKRVTAEYQQRKNFVSLREKSLRESLTTLVKTQREATTTENEALVKARAARDEEFSEIGGLGLRAVGNGVRAQAQRAIADQNEAVATEARRRKESAARAITQVGADLQALQTQGLESEVHQRQLLDGIDLQMKSDSRYVAPKSGLFADATIFIGLYTDPDVADGMRAISLITFGLLLVVELLALVALTLTPSTSFDVAVLTTEIKNAAAIVSKSELSDQVSDTMVSIAFTEGLSERHDDVKKAEALLRKSSLAKAINGIRKEQAEDLAPIDVRLAAVPASPGKAGKSQEKPEDDGSEEGLA